MVAGIAVMIVAHEHAPAPCNGGYVVGAGAVCMTGWPQTVYDLVRIGGWALLIFGVIVVALALIREIKGAR